MDECSFKTAFFQIRELKNSSPLFILTFNTWIMKRNFYFLSGLLLATFFLNGCEIEEESTLQNSFEDELYLQAPISENYDDYVNFMEPYESVLLNGYNISLEEVIKGDNSTTFVYLVKGTGSTAQMDSFYLNYPTCAGKVLDWSPIQASKLEEGSLKWNSSISKDGEQEFSISFEGNVRLGITEVVVVRGGIESTSKILGPCAGVYTLKGNIFIDANVNRTKEASESGIGGYSITLSQDVDGDDITDFSDRVETLGDGSYSFQVLEGAYKVSVGADLLNDRNYTATTATEFDVLVSANTSGINFGYKVETAKISSEFSDGTIPLNTEDYKYWIQQLKNIGKSNSSYSADDMKKLLTEVEMKLLPEPFYFGNNKIKGALDILTKPIKSDLDLYLQQLLTAELNVLSDKGALNPDGSLKSAFNEALLIYAEAIACEAMGSCPTEEQAATARAATMDAQRTSSTLSTDIELITKFNNGSGGL